MFRLFRWIRTNILYGAVALIPVAALLLVAYYLFSFWQTVLTPLTREFGLESWDSQLTAIGLAVLALLLISFIIGLIMRTRFGSWTYDKVEDRILRHVPGYSTISTLLRGFADDDQAYPAALVTLQPGGASVLAFVMEDTGQSHLTVFVPAAPMMTVGQIYFVLRENVEILPDVAGDATSAVSQWGVGLAIQYRSRPQNSSSIGILAPNIVIQKAHVLFATSKSQVIDINDVDAAHGGTMFGAHLGGVRSRANISKSQAPVAELVDARDSKSRSFGSVGSIPTGGTTIWRKAARETQTVARHVQSWPTRARRAFAGSWFASAFCLIFLTLSSLAVSGQAHATGPALLFDASTGAIIYSDEPDTRWHPASLTKLMTAYLVFSELRAGRLRMDDSIVTSKVARAVQPSKIGLPVGGKMPVRVGLDALIIKSANDVAIMFAERVAGSVPAFAQRMNATARRLGMTRTQFVNPNGLHNAQQYSTARDMGILARAIINDYPEHAALFTKSRMRFGKARLKSFNLLLKTFDGADGMKTGFVCASGFNIVSTATRNGRRLIAIVLGAVTAKERNHRAAQLLQHGFDNGVWKTFFFPTTLKTLAVAERSGGGPVNMRPKVHAWVCGWRKNRAKQQAAALRRSKWTTETRTSDESLPRAVASAFNTQR